MSKKPVPAESKIVRVSNAPEIEKFLKEYTSFSKNFDLQNFRFEFPMESPVSGLDAKLLSSTYTNPKEFETFFCKLARDYVPNPNAPRGKLNINNMVSHLFQYCFVKKKPFHYRSAYLQKMIDYSIKSIKESLAFDELFVNEVLSNARTILLNLEIPDHEHKPRKVLTKLKLDLLTIQLQVCEKSKKVELNIQEKLIVYYSFVNTYKIELNDPLTFKYTKIVCELCTTHLKIEFGQEWWRIGELTCAYLIIASKNLDPARALFKKMEIESKGFRDTESKNVGDKDKPYQSTITSLEARFTNMTALNAILEKKSERPPLRESINRALSLVDIYFKQVEQDEKYFNFTLDREAVNKFVVTAEVLKNKLKDFEIKPETQFFDTSDALLELFNSLRLINLTFLIREKLERIILFCAEESCQKAGMLDPRYNSQISEVYLAFLLNLDDREKYFSSSLDSAEEIEVVKAKKVVLENLYSFCFKDYSDKVEQLEAISKVCDYYWKIYERNREDILIERILFLAERSLSITFDEFIEQPEKYKHIQSIVYNIAFVQNIANKFVKTSLDSSSHSQSSPVSEPGILKLNAEVDALKIRIAEENTKLLQQEDILKGLSTDISEKNSEMKTLRSDQNAKFKNEIKEIVDQQENSIRKIKAKVSGLKNQCNQLAGKIKIESQKNKNLRKDLLELQEQKQRLDSQAPSQDELSLIDLQAEINNLEFEGSQLEKRCCDLKEKRHQLEKLQQDNRQLQKELLEEQKKYKALSALRTEQKNAPVQLQKAREDLATAEKELELVISTGSAASLPVQPPSTPFPRFQFSPQSLPVGVNNPNKPKK